MIRIRIFNGAAYWGTFGSWHTALAVLPTDALRAKWSITPVAWTVGPVLEIAFDITGI